MHGTLSGIHVTNPFGLVGLLVLWIVLFEGSHLLLSLVRKEPLIGWAVSPLGFTPLYPREPSILYILLNVFFPALISGIVLFIGLFSSFTPVKLAHQPISGILLMILGVVVTSSLDAINALRDLLYPLWGEARILRNIQILRSSWASIHFTPFGSSYLREQFGSNPADLLRSL